jgi:hypothetical protein
MVADELLRLVTSKDVTLIDVTDPYLRFREFSCLQSQGSSTLKLDTRGSLESTRPYFITYQDTNNL